MNIFAVFIKSKYGRKFDFYVDMSNYGLCIISTKNRTWALSVIHGFYYFQEFERNVHKL